MSSRRRGPGPSHVLTTPDHAGNVVGVDPHKRTVTATVADPRGGILASGHFRVSGDGHRALEAAPLLHSSGTSRTSSASSITFGSLLEQNEPMNALRPPRSEFFASIGRMLLTTATGRSGSCSASSARQPLAKALSTSTKSWSVEIGPGRCRVLRDQVARRSELSSGDGNAAVRFVMPIRGAKRSNGRWSSASVYQPMDRTTVSRDWHKHARQDATLRDMPLHALRHTAAAAWLAAGNSLMYVSGNSVTATSAPPSTTTATSSATCSPPAPSQQKTRSRGLRSGNAKATTVGLQWGRWRLARHRRPHRRVGPVLDNVILPSGRRAWTVRWRRSPAECR
jgi:hypothetical protein